MADVFPPLLVELQANANQLYAEFGKVAKATEQMTNLTTAEAGKMSKEFAEMGSQGGGGVGRGFLDSLKKFIVPIGAVIAGFGVGKVVKDSTSAYEEMAGGVKSLGRITGGTTEQVSKLAGAFRLTGVDLTGATTMLGRLSRNLVSAAGDTDKASLMASKLGTSFLGANGAVRPMAELLPEMADRFKSMPDGAEKTALAMQLFGRNGAQMLPFLNKGSAGVKELEAEAQRMGLTLDDLAMQKFSAASMASRTFQAQIYGLKATFGGALMPIIDQVQAAFYTGLAPAIQQVTDWLKNNQAAFEEIAGLLAGVVTDALSQLTPIIGQLVETLGPILMDTIKTLVPIIGDLVAMIGPILGDAIGTLVPIIGDLLAILGPALGDILKAVIPVIGDLVEILGPVLGEVIETLSPVLTILVESIGKIFAAVSPLIPAIVQLALAFLPLLEPITDLITMLLPPLVDILVPIIKLISDLATGVIGALLIPIIEVVIGYLQFWIDMFKGVFDAVGILFEFLNGEIDPKEFIDKMTSMSGPFGDLMRWTVDLTNGIKQFVADAVKNISNFAKGIGEGIGNAIEWFKSLPGKIVEALAGAVNWLVGIGKDIIQGLWNGLSNAWDWLIDQVKSLFGGLVGAVKAILGIKSPSRVFAEIGQNIGQGLVDGLDSMTGKVMDASKTLADAALQPFSSDLSGTLNASLTGSAGATGVVPAGGQTGGTTEQNTYNVNVTANTNASPYQIASTVGWQLRLMG